MQLSKHDDISFSFFCFLSEVGLGFGLVVVLEAEIVDGGHFGLHGKLRLALLLRHRLKIHHNFAKLIDRHLEQHVNIICFPNRNQTSSSLS